jgi:segregation and condensation protein A
MSEDRKALAKPPFNLLLNPAAMARQKPWDLDLSKLLEAFLKFLVDSGRIDLRVAGTAALSSALLYRLKVETFFVLERARIMRYAGALEDVPQLLEMPFRYELPSTTVEELLTAFERVLQEIVADSRKSRPSVLVEEPAPQFEGDPFEARIKEALDSFRIDILDRLAKAGRILFREVVEGLDLIEAARNFIMLLFLAQEGSVNLSEVEEGIVVMRVDLSASGPQ